jgi:sodium/potassium-transporting ATPase subunit alpha
MFWADFFEETDGETLVDRKLLSYAYLEAGVIQTLGACVTCHISSNLNLKC